MVHDLGKTSSNNGAVPGGTYKAKLTEGLSGEVVRLNLIPLSNPAVLGGGGSGGLPDARTKCPPELTKLTVGGLIPLGHLGFLP